MSAWKRGRGYTERHGWGPTALARQIGKQRRYERRHRTPEFEDRIRAQYAWFIEIERRAWEYYQCIPYSADRAVFDAAKASWEASSAALTKLRRVAT